MTEMLEFFDWDESRRDQAIDILVTCARELALQKISDVDHMETMLEKNLKQNGMSENEAKFLMRQLKLYLKNSEVGNEQASNK
jgi:hypothetical protein